MIRAADLMCHVEYAENGCWLWNGERNEDGYGLIRDPTFRRPQFVHIVAYRLWVGPILPGWEVDHRCHTFDLACPGGKHDDHRRCFHPDDLEAVTHAENTRRRDARRPPSAAQLRREQKAKQQAERDFWDAYWKAQRAEERLAREAFKSLV